MANDNIVSAVGTARRGSVAGVGAAPTTEAGEGLVPATAIGGEPATPKKRKKPSTFTAHGGRREVKAYPLTEHELTQLGLLQAGAAFTLAIAGALFGFWLNVTQAIAFAESTPGSVISFWEGLRLAALIGAVVLVVVTGFLAYLGWSMVGRIKKETIHE